MMENSYDRIAEQWHANFRGQPYIDKVLGYADRILDGLPPRARVLDLGCGTGNPIAKHIIERGFSVVAIDQSKEMLKIAKTVIPEAELIYGDMIETQLPGKLSAVVAWDSIFHVGRKYHSGIYRKISDALEIGGKLLLSTGGSDSGEAGVEGFTSEMFGHTFFYSGFAPKAARKLLEAAGFEIEIWEIDDPSSRGHIAVIARKIV